jgi:neutral trehalase
VERLFSADYDWHKIAASHPFQIQDILFNSVLCKSERDLAKIAEVVGKNPKLHIERADRMASAINAKLWSPQRGLYFSYDLVAGHLIERDTIFSYMPLYAEVCSAEQASLLIDNLKVHCYCVADRACVGVPSYDMCQADFNGEYYWRGPIWFNINWYLAQGLHHYGEGELAEWLEKSILQLVIDNGFYEYFVPKTGRGLGADGFSWTAALFIDLATRWLSSPR